MANYFIIGGDGKEYGPVTGADVRQWIAEGRLNAQSHAKSESDAEFRELAQFPELAEALASSAPMTIGALPTSAEFWERDYELDLGGCISRGFELVKTNGLLIGGVIVYGLIQMAFSVFGKIPFIGILFSVAKFVTFGAFLGGLFFLFLRVIRREPATLGDLFAGFRRSFAQLFLGTLVVGLLVGLTMLPFLIVFIIKLFPLVKDLNYPNTMSPQELVGLAKNIWNVAVLPSLWLLVICFIPATFLSVSWKFTLPLIIDRQMDFSAAMSASWKKVNRHWWQVFGLEILIGLVNVAGLCCCGVGLIFTVPIGYAALMLAYETIFNAKKN